MLSVATRLSWAGSESNCSLCNGMVNLAGHDQRNSMYKRLLILSALLCLAPPLQGRRQGQSNQKAVPKFGDFSVTEAFHGQPARPVLVTDGDRMFRTRIRSEARKGPNFAGHYTIVKWGCGSSCASFLVVDAISGRVYHNVFGILGFLYKGTASGRDYRGLEYRLSSSLLVIDGCPEHVKAESESKEEGDTCGTHYYKWERNQFVHLRSVSVPEAK